MSEKILVWVKECGEIAWNESWMNYLKRRIVRVKHFYGDEYKVKTSQWPVRDRKYWVIKSCDFIVITPEIRTTLIEIFKKDRSLFVLKDKKKE